MTRYIVERVIAVLAIAFLARFSPLVGVSAGHRGVVSLFGKVQPDALGEGLHVVNPFARITEITTRIQKTESQGDAASRDLQQVTTHIALQYHLKADLVASLYQRVGLGDEATRRRGDEATRRRSSRRRSRRRSRPSSRATPPRN